MSDTPVKDATDPLTAYIRRTQASPADSRNHSRQRRATPRYVFSDWALL